MKIIKYPQSCLMIETNNKKILVDPGSLKYQDAFLTKWQEADVILVTHKHFDHIYPEVLKSLNIPIYSTKEVQDTYPELDINIVKENDILTFGDIKVEVVRAIHGFNPLLKKGGEVFENVGYIIDDGKHRLYITSDTISFNNDYKADIVALPTTAHGITMSAYEAALWAKDMRAKLVLPVHMDNDFYPPDLEFIKQNFRNENIEFKILDIEEEIDIID